MARGESAPGGGLWVVAARAENGLNRGRRQRLSTNGMHCEMSRQSADSALAASTAADRVTRELDWTSPKRPGRGVPPPRSGLPPLGAT
jgi:hypothetical protein